MQPRQRTTTSRPIATAEHWAERLEGHGLCVQHMELSVRAPAPVQRGPTRSNSCAWADLAEVQVVDTAEQHEADPTSRPQRR
jgi:hypothetical protein